MGSLFIITAWWVQSWAGFSITGLLLADAVIKMSFLSSSKLGVPLGAIILPSSKRFNRYSSFRLPSWVLYIALVPAGLTMQYLWTDYRPVLEMAEVRIHTGMYYTGD